MSQAPSARALRVGIVIRDQLVEERMIRAATPVTFGQSLRCTLSVPVEGLPHDHVLFARDDGRVLLRLTAAMQGRLAHGSTVQTFDELRAGAGANGWGDRRRSGAGDRGVWSIPLPVGARGKLELAGVMILFQDVAAPAASPPLKLPASLRSTLADRIDKRLAVILGTSIVVHIAIATWAWATDVETGALGTPETPLTYRQETIDVTLPDFTPRVSSEPGVAAPVAPAQTPAPMVRATRIAPHAPPAMSDDDAARLAAILTNDDASTHGPAGMGSRSPGADLERQIAEVRGRPVTIGDDRGGFRNGRTHLGTGPGPTVHEPGEIVRIAPHTEQDPGRVIPGPVRTPGGPTTLTAAMVLDKINSAYMPGLQRCYRLGLNADRTLGGKVAVSFTVNETGRVTEAEASGVGGGVDTCIRRQMSGWHFTAPRTQTGEPTDASFEVSLALQAPS